MGYKGLGATNGQEALAVADDYLDKIHLVLTHVMMPKIGGKELVERLAARHQGAVLFRLHR